MHQPAADRPCPHYEMTVQSPPIRRQPYCFYVPLSDLLQTSRKFPPLSRRVELEATSLDSTLASPSSSYRFLLSGAPLDGVFNILKEFWPDVNHLNLPRKVLIKSLFVETVSMA